MREKPKYVLNPTSTKDQIAEASSSQKLAWKIAEAADEKKAANIVLLQVEDVSYLTDYFVIATGFSRTQLKAIADSIEQEVAQQLHKHPVRVEGKSEGSWIVQDYGEVIVHLFLPQEREYYNLEAFWGHAQRIEFSSVN